jgi:hypothetical protein
VNIWNSIPGSSQWLQNIQSNDEAILLHCYYDAETQFPQSTANDIFGHPNDHVNMLGERFSIDHRELDNVADNNENERDTIKYFIVTTREINNKINVDPHTPVITSESEFTDYINTICQRIFEERHPEETVPLYFYKSILYVAWCGGNEEVYNRINNQSLKQLIKAIKIGQSRSLFRWYRKMKELHSYWCGAGGLFCVAFGIPPLSNNRYHVESTYHLIYLLANLSGEFHLSTEVKQSFHTYINIMGLLGIRRGRIDDVIRPREQRNLPPGVIQQLAFMNPNEGSIYMIRRKLRQEWINELINIFNDIRGANHLPEDAKNLALRYIRIFLEHVKVGAIQGDLFDIGRSCRASKYLWSQPYSFEFILGTGFDNVWRDEYRFGNFIIKQWILGEFFFFTSFEDMRGAFAAFVRRNNNVGIQGIGQTRELSRTSHNGRETVSFVEISTITNLIERGIITADFVRDLMERGAYRLEICRRDINVNF